MKNRCLLYYITDRTQFPGTEASRRSRLVEKIAAAARSGVDYIQLREKDLSARDLEMLAREAVSVVRKNSNLSAEHSPLATRFLVNSRTDVALAVEADGVHLRSDDVSPAVARNAWSLAHSRNPKLANRNWSIGVSCHSAADIQRAQEDGADFAVFAPVFEKPVFDKKEAPTTHPAGVEALRQACQHKIPVFALGGVTLDNAAACLEAGAAGIAAIRLFQENDIGKVVQVLRALGPA